MTYGRQAGQTRTSATGTRSKPPGEDLSSPGEDLPSQIRRVEQIERSVLTTRMYDCSVEMQQR